MGYLITWLRAALDEREDTIRYCLDHGEQMFRPDHDLDDIDAKRRIIELHPSANLLSAPESCESCVVIPGPCATLRLLALPFSDRPGYRDEWRP